VDETGTVDIFLMFKLLCVAIAIKFNCVSHYKQKLYLTMLNFKITITEAVQDVNVRQPTHTGWKLVMAESECWFLMMMYQIQSIFITELGERIIN
jgi:hypothetical protein